jgi:hypothetical protein
VDLSPAIRRGRYALTPLLRVAIAMLVAVPATAIAKGKGKPTYVPPKGKIYAGVSDTGQGSDYREYRKATRAHPAVMQAFESWGNVPGEAIRRWQDTNTRGMISLSTGRCWMCEPVISAQSIASGKGDRFLLALAKALDKHDEPTYIRLFPEMNGHWNGYCAYNGGGSARKDEHSTANFKRAWKRIVTILRGGDRKKVEQKLKKLNLAKLKAKSKSRMPTPKVAFGWVPHSFSTPNIPGNQPADYFPGYDFVDWVGGDIYGSSPSFAGLDSLYKKYSKAPFMIGEWAPRGRDDPGFTSNLFKWVEKHKRTKMAVYYQGFGEGPDNEFEIGDYPKSRSVIRKRLNSKKYLSYAPENKKKKGGKGNGGSGKGNGPKGNGKP